MEGSGTFATLHNAYLDEWLSIAFLPHVKQTFNTENNFYDISAVNMKKVNVKLLPVAEAVMAMDRQYQSMRFALERSLSEVASFDIDRLLLIEAHQSSFSTFIEAQRILLEKAIIDIGGTPSTTTTISTSLSGSQTLLPPPPGGPEDPQSLQTQTMIGSRRPTPAPPSIVSSARSKLKSDGAFGMLGPIALLWVEFMNLLSKIVDDKERLFYLESTINNLAFSVIEWRIMLANSQKIINEEKKVKKVNIYDQVSSSFISSPISTPTQHPQQAGDNSGSLFGGIDIDLAPMSMSSSYQTPTKKPPLSSTYHSPPKYPLPPVPFASNNNTNSSSSSEMLIDVSSTDNSNNNNFAIATSFTMTPEKGGWHKAVVTKPPANNSVNNSSSNSNSNLNEPVTFQANPLEAMSKGVPSGGIIKQGWMRKRGNKVKSWKKRYFILDMRKTMIYYDLPKKEKEEQTSHITTPQLTTNTFDIEPNGTSKDKDKDKDGESKDIKTSSSNLPEQINYELLKYKGSIDLHTAIFVAIKPNNCNINVNFDNNSTSSKDKDSDQYFGIDIRTPKRIWHLCCDSSKSMDDWLVALKSALKY